MLLARVLGGRIDIVTGADLLDPIQPLELRSVHHRHQQRVQLNGAVNTVVDALPLLRMLR
jgi:hypothetical protein